MQCTDLEGDPVYHIGLSEARTPQREREICIVMMICNTMMLDCLIWYDMTIVTNSAIPDTRHHTLHFIIVVQYVQPIHDTCCKQCIHYDKYVRHMVHTEHNMHTILHMLYTILTKH